MSEYHNNYNWINLDMENATSATKRARMEQRSGRRYLQQASEWLVGVDRFTLKNALLPLYRDRVTLTVRITDTDTSATQTADLDFSAVTDSDGFIYDYIVYANALADAIDTAETAIGTPSADQVDVFWNNENRTLSILSSSNFRNAYTLEFDQALYTHTVSFPFVGVQPSDQWFLLDLSAGVDKGSGDIEISMSEPIQISPVNTILLVSNTIPVVPEIAGTRESNGGADKEPTNISIVTDFSVHSINNIALHTYEFESRGNIRWHSMQQDSDFNVINAEFQWRDFKGDVYPLQIFSGGGAYTKLGFKKERKAMVVRK